MGAVQWERRLRLTISAYSIAVAPPKIWAKRLNSLM